MPDDCRGSGSVTDEALDALIAAEVQANRDAAALRDTGPRPDSGIEAPIGDQPDSITVNGHMFVHVAACPCERIQAEVARLSTPRTETSEPIENGWSEYDAPPPGDSDR